MTSQQENKTLDAWIHELDAIMKHEYGMVNGWTLESLKANFANRYYEGKTPYQALALEGYKSLEERSKE